VIGLNASRVEDVRDLATADFESGPNEGRFSRGADVGCDLSPVVR